MIDTKTQNTGKPSELRKLAERKADQSPENTELLSSEETQQVLHELRVHQIELEMQNEELRTSQAELDASRMRYFDLYDLAPVGYFTISEKGLILEANLTAAILFGEARGLLVKRPFFQFILLEDQDIYYLHRSQLFETKEPQSFELRMLKKDGTSFWANLAATVTETDDGAAMYRVVLIDITERKKEEGEKKALLTTIEQEKNRLLSLVNGISDEIWFADKQGNFMLANPSALREFGLSIDDPIEIEKLAKSLEVLRPDGSPRPAEEAPPLLALSGKVVINQEEMVRTPRSGELRYRQVSSNPVRDAAGNIIGAVSVVRDITERKRNEEAIRVSEASFRTLFQNVPMSGVIYRLIRDTQNEIVDWEIQEINGLGAADLSQTPSELIGKRAIALFGAEVMKPYLELCRSVIASNHPQQLETHFAHNDKHYLTYVFAIGSEHYANVSVDISERKKADEEKTRMENQLHQSQKLESIGHLAGGIAHDFNNMLSVINGYSEIVLSKMNASDPNYSRVQEIDKAGKRSADLTRQLLTFARKQTIAPKVLDMNVSVAGILNMLQRLIGENIELLWNPVANLWNVKMDPSQIDQILANLIVNTRDAISGNGKVIIETDNAEVDETFCKGHLDFVPGKYVVLSVSDNGCGMSKEILEHIFEPFYTTKEVGKGTGLGLATVFGIVKQNDGFIDVYSEPGKGTTFKIYLPRHESENVGQEVKHEKTKRITGTETVLLVEDETAMLQFVKSQLEDLGYTVLTTDRPIKAIKIAGEYKGDIHLFMTDVVMPEMSGRDLKEKINQIRSGIKCLFMSGYSKDIMSHNGVLDEGIHFLQKPFTAEALSVKVREALA